MKTYTLPFAQAVEHKPEYPERTARKSTRGWDITFQVWPNRASLAKTIRMQQRRATRMDDWKPCVPLGVTEGY